MKEGGEGGWCKDLCAEAHSIWGHVPKIVFVVSLSNSDAMILYRQELIKSWTREGVTPYTTNTTGEIQTWHPVYYVSNQKQPSCKKRSVALEKAMVKKDVKSKVAAKKWL